MKKTIISFFISCLSIIAFGQANTYFHDRIDTTLFAIADTVGHGSNHYYATNLTPDFNVKQYVNGCTVNLFFKKGNTGSATLTLVTKTGTLSSKTIRKANGQVLLSGDIPDSTAVILDYYNGSFRIAGIGVTASSSSWLLTGNSGTTPGTNFVGTTDAKDLVFKRDNTEVMRLYSSNNYVGIGETAPSGRLHIKGSTSNSSAFALKADNSSSLPLLYVENDFLVGIHTATPAYPLDVWGENNAGGNFDATIRAFTNGTGQARLILKDNGQEYRMVVNDSDHGNSLLFINATSGTPYSMELNTSGNLGIGDPTITARLHVKGSGATSATYSFKVDNSSSTPLFYVRDDGFIGAGVGTSLTVGFSSAFDNTEIGNTGIGIGTGGGSRNTFIGNYAGSSMTSGAGGARNVAIGQNALISATSDFGSVAVGWSALSSQNGVSSTSIGVQNVSIGINSSASITSGNTNVVVGSSALNSAITGSENTAIGGAAGYTNTGSGSVFLGAFAGYYETGSNKLYIDNAKRANINDSHIKSLIYGSFSIDSSLQFIKVNGEIRFTKGIDVTAGDAATVQGQVGQFVKDASGTTFTLTNALIKSNSIILLTWAGDPGGGSAHDISVVAGAGSAVITFGAAPSGSTPVNFGIFNNN